MARRKALSKKTRFDVFKRDGFQCAYCGSSPPDVLLHVDHIVAVADGGTNDPANLITACANCNLGKGARAIDSAPAPLDAEGRSEDLRAKIEQLNEYRLWLAEWNAQRREIDDTHVMLVAEAYAGKPGVTWLEENASETRASVLYFVRKLGIQKTIELASRSRAPNVRKQFNYFAKCCHDEIKGGS